MAGTRRAISTTNTSSVGAGAYWANSPASSGPEASPIRLRVAATLLACVRLAEGSSSVRAAVASAGDESHGKSRKDSTEQKFRYARSENEDDGAHNGGRNSEKDHRSATNGIGCAGQEQ